MKNKWEKDTLLRVRREFSEIEKYKLLISDYNQMKNKLENYKAEVIKLKEHHVTLKKQHAELQDKYTKLNNR